MHDIMDNHIHDIMDNPIHDIMDNPMHDIMDNPIHDHLLCLALGLIHSIKVVGIPTN